MARPYSLNLRERDAPCISQLIPLFPESVVRCVRWGGHDGKTNPFNDPRGRRGKVDRVLPHGLWHDGQGQVRFRKLHLIYLAGSGSHFELELAINKGQDAPYELGHGYGHLAFAVDNLEATHAAVKAAGHAPRDIVEFRPDGENLLAKFFFIADPDGYQIEVLQASGRDQ